LTDDFNLIYHTVDKNNDRLNHRMMGLFRHFLNSARLKEVNLHNCLFTWSNERHHPTLERIDSAFISKEWDELFPDNDMHLLPSICSDHAPLLFHLDNDFRYRRRFHFRPFWQRL
jgi:hypothetical protein